MAASRQRPLNVGVIAEDDSDVEVVRLVLPKIDRGKRFGVKRFVGHGCGKLKNKCCSWAGTLANRGCSVLIMVHDLDHARLPELRRTLREALNSSAIERRIVVIPIQELEAWLLTDPAALKAVFGLKKLPKCPANPENVDDPKEFLRDLIWRTSGKTRRYINTVHNRKIAEHISLAALSKCEAFVPLRDFWRAL